MAKKNATKQKAQPPVKQTDRDDKGRFLEGNGAGNRFPPGVSGNPKGPPVRRTQLWVYFCQFMNLTDAELEELDRTKLTQSQQTALKMVENAKAGKGSGSERLALNVFDREEGRPTEHLLVGTESVLSDEECEGIRRMLRGHADE
jgi:hypothetical protein